MRKPSGHIRPHGAGYQVAVPVGRDPITKRYRYTYDQAATLEEAQTLRQRMIDQVTSGRKPRTQATFGQLLDEVIKVTDLDPQTTYTYEGYIERTIRPALGTIPVHDLEERPELIDRLYAELRRCGKLCGGRRAFHRRAGPRHHQADAWLRRPVEVARRAPGPGRVLARGHRRARRPAHAR
jgi:integrase